MSKNQPTQDSGQDSLKFHVAPHIVQDLGLNLYTSLPRVLVEFVANAYDADSPVAEILLDMDRIEKARDVLKKEWELERSKRKAVGEPDPEDSIPLEMRTLPPDIEIIVSDKGHGMSRDDLQDKFLIVGRRRRNEDKTARSPKGRIIMGRKGLGKLAGFGVAHNVIVISRKEGEAHATEITLNYDALVDKERTEDIQVPTRTIPDGGGIDPHGTKIILSQLVYESVKHREATITNSIGDNFAIIREEEFKITLNANPIKPSPRDFVFAYPESPTLTPEDTFTYTLPIEDGDPLQFDYRIRFTGPGKQLNAKERGVRIYSHNRLAAVPDLLDLKTGVHGFQNINYLDGIIVADFIDDQPVDYISTDRQTLRWETPLLTPLRVFLTQEMTNAIAAYQKVKDEDMSRIIENDTFTKDVIENAVLPPHRKRSAFKIAATLASGLGEQTKDPFYKKALPLLVKGLGQGEILTAISTLASQDIPDFQQLINEITRLTAQEFDEFATVVNGRLEGIEALRKLYRDVDFKAGHNEDALHRLFEKNPWLIDPTFSQFLSSDETENELNHRLAKALAIGKYSPSGYSKTEPKETEPMGTNKRPDLVFLLSNAGLHRIIIVELKAPNTPLHNGHLRQLKRYIQRTEEWLAEQGGRKAEYKVEGYLIGSKADPKSTAEEVVELRYEIDKNMDNASWKVYDIGDVLDRTEEAHRQLLDIYNRAAKRSVSGV